MVKKSWYGMIPQLLRAYINRLFLINIRNILRFFIVAIESFYLFVTMSNPKSESESQPSASEAAPFDPTQPSIPISYPMKTLEELESRSYFESFHYPFNKASVPIVPNASSLPNRRRLLVCHDMAGGYLDDKWIQGGTNPHAYAIWHWHLIDVFVYFSHTLVTLPPPCWINTAHRHGVKVLGTFITEWDEGRAACDTLLSTKESAQMYAEHLAELAVDLGFDGWLINMEVNLNPGQISNLKEFWLMPKVEYDVSWSCRYDSVTVDGKLKWQDQLNKHNKPFFDICDGIFVNYTWKEDYPRLSAAVASDRKYDVYMGIDVFGRNTYGGGQWNANVALDLLRKNDISAAIFAPGWVYETKQAPDFETAQNSWWGLVENSWGVLQKSPGVLPFYTNFDQGRGYHISVHGDNVSEATWNNISCQGFQPLLEFADPTNSIQVLVDLKETSYSGGGNVTFKGSLGEQNYIEKKIFQGQLLLSKLPIHFIYSVKSDGNSSLGLKLEFTSTNHQRTSILLTSWVANHFSSKFSKVIMTREHKEFSPGWVINEGVIAMNESYTLTEIHAVCYRSDSPFNDSDGTVASSSEYFALLGHITIKTSDYKSDFPVSSSWIVDGSYIKWISGSLGSKTLSVKISWNLKDVENYLFPKYNVYLVKLSKQESGKPGTTLDHVKEYLGVAQVNCFYVSDLKVPSGTSSLKFIIQVCGVDGTLQELDESPSYELEVEAP
ncbi:cytosolic endo-beta-N-acetylglucosaminidase 1-like isoform X2 [Abrus precatorius]|uniref:mannosyl-glycoprotein endo-beta-N-acetylglucosaminidase n=1 Tax=Abrus precatorius TaxID=3816 RepID=A0A8B8JU48_ABRPR|nr:cytosolic endo-beta-N-acetylglucosaminidase 1-like isoform X2 [Abrus precatorius]